MTFHHSQDIQIVHASERLYSQSQVHAIPLSPSRPRPDTGNLVNYWHEKTHYRIPLVSFATGFGIANLILVFQGKPLELNYANALTYGVVISVM
jgi:hypothetical protein